MKKLMFALAAVAMAAVSQAASVSWNVSGVTESGSLVDGYAYVFCNKGTYATPAALSAALGECTTIAEVEAILGGSLSSMNAAIKDGGVVVTGVDLGTSGIPGKTSGTKIFAVITDTATLTDDTKWFVTEVSNTVKTPDPATQNPASYTIPDQTAASTAAGAWQSVPEPTSGLLLLLGVAGLALKRRRA